MKTKFYVKIIFNGTAREELAGLIEKTAEFLEKDERVYGYFVYWRERQCAEEGDFISINADAMNPRSIGEQERLEEELREEICNIEYKLND